MSERNVWCKGASALVLALGLVGLALGQGGLVEVPLSGEPRVPAAKVVEAEGLLASEAGEPFTRVQSKETVFSRDVLVALPGLKAKLQPRPQSVTLTLWGNLPGLSDSPVLETAVILHDSRTYDLDFTLLRGRIILTSNKTKGPARVWLRRGNVGVEFTLPEEGDSLALQVSGHWPTGVPFKLHSKAEPLISWELAVLKGNVEIKANNQVYALSAPPGPSYFRGDSLAGPDPEGPQRLAKPPAWANPAASLSLRGKQIASLVEEYRDKLKARKAHEAGLELLAAAEKDPDKLRARDARRLYVYALAATDAIDRVARALADDQHEDTRKTAARALRHWIGAAPGRDDKLYETLTGGLRYTNAEAETIMQLLHSQFPPDQPETYETLIAYLNHGKLAVRELAAGHLYQLAPVGHDIPYDAAASPAERKKAAGAWKKLIPSGELPPKEPKKE
jgi:hypothetical protein